MNLFVSRQAKNRDGDGLFPLNHRDFCQQKSGFPEGPPIGPILSFPEFFSMTLVMERKEMKSLYEEKNLTPSSLLSHIIFILNGSLRGSPTEKGEPGFERKRGEKEKARNHPPQPEMVQRLLYLPGSLSQESLRKIL
jgi:hypothetical protein